MVGSKNQHIKAMMDVLANIAAQVTTGHYMSDAVSVDALAIENYERVSCRFSDGVGVTLIIDVDNEGGE